MNLTAAIAILALALLSGIIACGPRVVPPTPTPTSTPTLLPPASTRTPLPTPTPPLPADWQTIVPGIEARTIDIPRPDPETPAGVSVVRIDPAQVTMRVHYDPANPVTVEEWQAQTGAAVVINAAFFQEDYTVAGLLVTGGEVYGISFDQIEAPYYEFGGMFGIASGALDIRSTELFQYTPGEALDDAVQGLPLLLDDGRIPVPFTLPDRQARRTVVALDTSGRLVLISVYDGAISLYGLRDWLAASDELALDSALNLDGGPSSGLVIRAGGWSVVQDSFTPVSSVVAVYPK